MWELLCEPENFTGRIMFMSMFDDIWWNMWKTIQRQLNNMLVDSLAVIGLSWSLDLKRSGTELTMANQMDFGIERRRKCCWPSQKTEHPVFRGNQCLGERRFKKQRKWKEANTLQWQHQKYWIASPKVISVNHLGLHGAVADMIEELPVGQKALGKPKAPGQLDKQEILAQPPLAEVQANEERQRKLVTRIRATIWWEIVRRPEVIQTMLRSGFGISRSWTILLCSSVTKRRRKSIFMPENVRCLDIKKDSYQRVDPKQWTIWPSLGHKSLQSPWKIQYLSSGSISVSRSNCILDKNCELYWQICQRSHADLRGRKSFGVKPAAKARLNISTFINKWCGTLLLLNRENGLTLKHWNPRIFIVCKCRNSALDYFDTVKKFIEKEIGGINYDQVIDECKKKSNPTFQDIDQKRWRSTSSMLSIDH